MFLFWGVVKEKIQKAKGVPNSTEFMVLDMANSRTGRVYWSHD